MTLKEIPQSIQGIATLDIPHVIAKLQNTFASVTLVTWQSIAFLGLFIVWKLQYTRSVYVNVPTLGVNIFIIGTWLEACRFVWDSATLIEEGIQKYGPERKSFKISTPARWVVVATDPAVLDEMKNADETVLSMQAAANQRNSISYTLSSSIHGNPYHVEMIRRNITQHLGKILPEIVEEISLTFRGLGASNIGKEWVKIDNDLLSECISTTTNRVLVGLPLSRDPEYLNCLVKLSKLVSRAGVIIDLAPRALKSIISYFLVQRSSALQMFLSKLGPVFEERRRILELGDNWENKLNDAVQWVLEATPPNTSLYELCIRILYLDFSAIHTSSVSITQALYDLATHPEFHDPIRDEIESVLSESGGWTKQALTKMTKLDSSLKESLRLHPVTTATMMRRAQKPHTLADGTFLPKGQWVVAPAYSINRSAENYSNPGKFDAFRFSRLREAVGHETRHQLACPGDDYLTFGMGKHACPGRFFAATELKVLLAYIICNYDFKIGGIRPQSKFFSFSCSPDLKTELFFRARVNSGESLVNKEIECKG